MAKAKKAKKATVKAARKPAGRAASRKKTRSAKSEDARFIMVVAPRFKERMKAAAKKATVKAGSHVSMSAWVRQALEKAMH